MANIQSSNRWFSWCLHTFVINSLYSDRDIFLRELLSNASDAIQKRKFLGQTDPAVLNNEIDNIEIVINKKKKIIEITDL